MKKRFYITSAIPYVNAAPHIGHAQEFVEVDSVARFHRLIGDDVIALSGADENALKNVQAAEKTGLNVKELVSKNNSLFVKLTNKLNVCFDIWQRGSDQKHHFPSSQLLWKRCTKRGDIYKKSYKGLYCVGCETFYSPDELDEKGECFEHPGVKLEEVEEKNYFFRLSKYQNELISLIKTGEYEIIPEIRKNEVIAFLQRGLQDISISRTNKRARNWGVPVPGDPSQRMYVWFDALNIYQSGIGFGWNEEFYNKSWPADVHVIGKGITRFHAVYWPAFLLSAKLDLPKRLFVHGYITIDGQKMSKTIGNVIDPFDLIKQYGTDAVRYYLLREIPSYGDGDFSHRRFKEVYNADLANGLGNLIMRIFRLVDQKSLDLSKIQKPGQNRIIREIIPILDEFKLDKALSCIWNAISGLDKYINNEHPWGRSIDEARNVLKTILIGSESVTSLWEIAESLNAFLPDTAQRIQNHLAGKKAIVKPLFPRIN